MSDHKPIKEFIAYLRTIPRDFLFMILSKYTSLSDIDTLYNDLAKCESEEDLRKLEQMLNEFIKKDKVE